MTNFVKAEDVKRGDELFCDNGFPCLVARSVRKVKEDKFGELFIDCSHGKHYLDESQLNNDGLLVGLSRFVPNKFKQDL